MGGGEKHRPIFACRFSLIAIRWCQIRSAICAVKAAVSSGGCVGLAGFIFIFFSFPPARSPVPRGLGGDAGKGTEEPGRGWPWDPSFPGAWKIAFLLKMTVANPASIFSGGVVSRWRGMLPARLLPAPSLP